MSAKRPPVITEDLRRIANTDSMTELVTILKGENFGDYNEFYSHCIYHGCSDDDNVIIGRPAG